MTERILFCLVGFVTICFKFADILSNSLTLISLMSPPPMKKALGNFDLSWLYPLMIKSTVFVFFLLRGGEYIEQTMTIMSAASAAFGLTIPKQTSTLSGL